MLNLVFMRLHHLKFLNVNYTNQTTKGNNHTNKRRKMLKCSTFQLVFRQTFHSRMEVHARKKM